MWRTMDVHWRAVRVQARLIRTILNLFSKPPSYSCCHHHQRRLLSLSHFKTLTLRTTNSCSFSSSSSSSLHFNFSSEFVSPVLRCISSASSAQPHPVVNWNEAVSCSEIGDGRSNRSLEEDRKTSIPVKAYFFSTSVDLKSLVDQNKQNFIPPTSRMTNYVVLKFGNFSDFNGMGACISGSDCCLMVVFQYGSIVLFNVSENEVDRYLKIVERYSSGLLPEMRKDEYEVIEKPTLSTWMQGGLDHIMLQYLNIDGIRIIGSVLGQSIALDYYVRQVDGMVAEFTDINRGMEKTGTFTMESKKLFQLVGKANSNLADVILRLGLFERSDIAWKDAKYAQIWEYLRDEFELTQRFASLDFKLKFVEGFGEMADAPTSPAGGSHESGGEQSPRSGVREQDRYLPIANISRIMKKALPPNGKIAKDAKDTVQECVSEFISFITSEASDKCQKEKRKTVNGDDLLWAMATLGFEDYIEPLKAYLMRYRELEGDTKGSARGGDGPAKRDTVGTLPGQNTQAQGQYMIAPSMHGNE